MRLTLAQLTDKLERACDEKEELEARQDEIWVDYENVMYRWRKWQADANALNERMDRLAALVPGCLGAPTKEPAI
jgi:predicted nuclease with TOPRIM domain